MGITEITPIVIALIGMASGIASTVITIRGNRKTKVEAQSLEDQITERVLARAKADMDRMQGEIDELREELAVYRLWSSMLCNQVTQLGQVPVPIPDRKHRDTRP